MLYALILGLLFVSSEASCPWDAPDLLPWSDASTWGGSVPAQGAAVVVSGKKVILDVSPPKLTSITIEADGMLVWGNVDGIKVTTDYILVKGEFHIGSDTCRFTKKAHILLTGLSNSTNSVAGFDTKFLGVPEGGTLEIHGAEKLPFTKLTQTLPAASETCGGVYSHQKQNFSQEVAFGLHVTLWNADGSFRDFNVFPLGDSSAKNAEQDFYDFVQGVDDGVVVAVAVYGDLSVRLTRNWELVYSSIETLGGISSGTSQIRNVRDKEAYAFITVKGQSSSTKEERKKLLYLYDFTETSKQKYINNDAGLEFSTRSIVKAKDEATVENRVEFNVLTLDVAQPKIKVLHDVSSWNVGDKVVIPSSGFNWEEFEEFTLVECTGCDKYTLRLDADAKYTHFGKITYGVDERVEVALLTRNILIEGEVQEECYHGDRKELALCKKFKRDTFGGHVKFLKGFKSVHVQGTESYHMGQQIQIGTYPIHYHMCDDVDGSWVRYNSIHHTNNRCITIHGTDGAELTGNVCHDHPGHGYFLEDSVEIRNILDGNLGVATRFGTQLLTDKHPDWCGNIQKKSCGVPATYWITHPNNYMKNNVAAGSIANGFHIVYSFKPLAVSIERQKIRKIVTEFHAARSRLGQFDDNVAHSNLERGFLFDKLISAGQYDRLTGEWVPENGLLGVNEYEPKVDPYDPDSANAVGHIRRYTGYKNKENIWTRGGNFVIENCSVADSESGILLASTKSNTFQEIKRCLVIGESENTGSPFKFYDGTLPGRPSHVFQREYPKKKDPYHPLIGVEYFNGPVIVTDCVFDKFNHHVWNSSWEQLYGVKARRPGSALGFRPNFPYPSLPHNGFRQLKFGFCDKVDGLSIFVMDNSKIPRDERRDGDLQTHVRDMDGSITGVPDTQFVRNVPFFMDTDCYYDDVYQLSVCPHWYSKILFEGSNGVFTGQNRKYQNDYPLVMYRDDDSSNPFALKGEKELSFLTIQNKSYIAVFNGSNPTKIGFEVNNLQLGNWIRVGICFPKSTTSFTITSKYPEINDDYPAISVSSIQELENDQTGRAYYWDKNTGLLFFRFVGRIQPEGFEECPGYKCPRYDIERNDGGSDPTNCSNDAYGPYKVARSTKTPIVPPNKTCERASLDGYGAMNTSNASQNTSEFSPTCAADNTVVRPSPQYRGCYKATSPGFINAKETQTLTESMTKDLCTNRCYDMGYRYAVIAFGNNCKCTNDFAIHGVVSTFCSKICSGNDAEYCGGGTSYDVYKTGRELAVNSTQCGSNNEGIQLEGKCYIYKSNPLNFIEAERECRLLGGNLASIPNGQVQERLEEEYLTQFNQDVWIGTSDVITEGQFINTDGSVQDDFTFFPGETTTGILDFVSLNAGDYYHWVENLENRSLPFVCQVANSATPLTVESCGVNNAGKKLSNSNNCYALIHEKNSFRDAKYACARMMGFLAKMPDDSAQADIREHLIRYGNKMSYWVNELQKSERYYALEYDMIYQKRDYGTTVKHGAVCTLETLNANKPCAKGWKKAGNNCYLYTKVSVKRWTDAQKLCKSDLTSLVSIESTEENSDVVALVRSLNPSKRPAVFLGYKYNPTANQFQWSDNSTSTYTNWARGQGVSAVSKSGECARLLTTNGIWKNKKCESSNAHIVCKTDAAT